MWRNDLKCKYMFMFPLKNLARQGLIITFIRSYSANNVESTSLSWHHHVQSSRVVYIFLIFFVNWLLFFFAKRFCISIVTLQVKFTQTAMCYYHCVSRLPEKHFNYNPDTYLALWINFVSSMSVYLVLPHLNNVNKCDTKSEPTPSP